MASMSMRATMVLVFLMVSTAALPLLTANASTGGRTSVETEGNNSYATANEIFAGDRVSGKLNWTDANDVFKINCTGGKILNVSLWLVDYNPAQEFQYDIDYQLMNPEMYFLVDHWWQTWRMDTVSIMIYESGMHYIWLYANGTAGTHTMETRYVLSVNQVDAISTGSGTVVGNLNINPYSASASYTDAWYKLTFPAGQGARANLTVPTSGDFDLYLFTTWPPQPKYVTGLSCPYSLNESWHNRTGSFEEVEGLSMDGTYYLKVYGWSGSGAFSLKIEQASVSNLDDGDSTPATAKVVTPAKSDRIMMGSLHQSYDSVDWYKVHINTTEYVNADLDLMTYGSKVDVLIGFTDQWFTTMLWSYTTVTGGLYDWQSNALDGSAAIKFAPWSDGATVPGDYYFFIHTAWRMQDTNYFQPAETMYRITWDLPNYGAISKGTPLPQIKVPEGGTNNSLNLNNYFGDREGDTLSYSFAPTNVPNVTVAINQTSSKVTVTPKPYYNNGGKPINITFKATDASADWGTKFSQLDTTIVITPVNFAPLVQLPIQNMTLDEGKANRTSPADMGTAFIDPDGDPLIYRVLGMDHVIASIDQVTHILTVGPVNKWFGTETITAQAEDTGGLRANITFTVTVRHVNHQPTPKGGFNKWFHNITENTVDSKLNVSRMFDDVDIEYAGDSLRFNVEYTYEHPENPNLKASIEGDFMTLKPATNWSGEAEVPVAARDLNGTKAMMYVQVTILNVNQPPIIQEAAPSTLQVVMKEGELKTFSITKVFDSDTDQTITYRWYLDNKLLPTMATANSYSFETDFLNKSGGKPSAGNYTLQVIVSDGALSANVTWKIRVENVNRKPSQAAITEPAPAKKFKNGEKVTFRAGAATDPDGDTLTYTWKDETTNTVMGTGPSLIYPIKGTGDHKITLTVDDGNGGSTSVSVTINVKKAEPGGVGGMMMYAIIAIVVIIVVVVIVALMMMKRKGPKPANTQAEVASNYEAQLWGKDGSRTRPASPPPQSSPAVRPRVMPQAQEPPAEDIGAQEPVAEEPAVPTWSPGGAAVQEAPQPEVPRAAAAKVAPGPPKPGPP